MEAEEALQKSAAALSSEKQQQLRIATHSIFSMNLLAGLLNDFNSGVCARRTVSRKEIRPLRRAVSLFLYPDPEFRHYTQL